MQHMYPNPTAYAIQSESALTNDVIVSRNKRSRDYDDASIMYSSPLVQPPSPFSNNCYSFLGEDFSSHFLQHQLEIDRFILHQTENLRREIQRQFTSRVAADVQANMAKKLKSKDDQLEKIGKLNSTLEERLKSLFLENQILKELAQRNEATANVLRSNLEEVLQQAQQIQNQEENGDGDGDDDDDAESWCCGSNNGGKNERKRKRVCRRCGKREAEVVVLPCRHLSECRECGSSSSTNNTCPLCNLPKTATLHLNNLLPS